MEFSKLIRNRRLDLKLGVRETARLTEQPYIPHPIKSAVYITRIESGDSTIMPVESVTIDKTWALGCVLHFNPFELFLMTREREDLVPLLSGFSVQTCEPVKFGDFIRARRSELKLSIRDAATKAAEWYIAPGYWSQMETDFRECTSKISGEKLWGMAYVLGVDPTLLYVLSRRLDDRYLNPDSRNRLFS